ncbi:hypothetical protein [Aliikangiella coralliicola]|uniref:Uncharacterized protein n=1 Tax=Aliikangiella coralliicola TaxID=2592383 RepID=A0A545UFR2_9GAMM|nr:hypothetical protein [Aliikangiella coralliicola]TQV88311.1 hypothetical protein FLL46_07230 [Aliikangiella coralliicola]
MTKLSKLSVCIFLFGFLPALGWVVLITMFLHKMAEWWGYLGYFCAICGCLGLFLSLPRNLYRTTKAKYASILIIVDIIVMSAVFIEFKGYRRIFSFESLAMLLPIFMGGLAITRNMIGEFSITINFERQS